MSPAQIEQLALEAGIAITAAGMVIDGEYGGLHIRKLVERFAEVVLAAALEERRLTLTKRPDGELVMVSWQDDEHRILEVVWEKA